MEDTYGQGIETGSAGAGDREELLRQVRGSETDSGRAAASY